ncbi:hypothetical protein [Corynebacterium oculi]|uniref:DUF975 family protein n=1 Tax=Corynebacterium oculi TaxID=1544416 RepID=A0A0Q1DYU0_9CORY|nr:hypothetical protein [Corynebacterium oculi]KQB85419.1 hypothetical protein Cocul_00558 [Corynebacterium oculi]
MTYPSTPHPEDSPGFDKYPQYVQETPEWAQEKPREGTGKVNVGEAISWGFKAVFSSWYIWIIGTLILGIVTAALFFVVSFLPAMEAMDSIEADEMYTTTNLGDDWGSLLMSVGQVLITPFILTGLLAQVNKKRVGLGDFFRNVRYFQVLALSIVQFFLSVVGLAIVVVPLVVAVVTTGANDLFIVGILGAVMILSFLINPFFIFWNWYAADGYGFKESIVLGFKAGKRNYGVLLLFSFAGGIALVLGGLFTFTLGFLVLLPAYYLIYAHMFRQASQGALPAA